MATGQWLTPRDGIRWWYDSGAISLDFAHTGVLDDPPAAEQLSSPVGLSAWLGARFDRVADDAGDRDLADALSLRAAICRLARAQADGSVMAGDDVDTLNLYAATLDIPPALDGGNRQAGRTRVRVGQALVSVARDAVALLGHAEGRIRECAAENCQLVFYDESRTNNRRWCSMQRCGNRAKVKSFRARSGE